MAQAKTAAKTSNAPQWCNYDLTLSDKEQLKKVFGEQAALDDALEKVLSDGYKLSVTWDGWAKGIACYLFPTQSTPINAGLALSARGRSYKGALAGLLYRHYVVFEGNWRASATSAVFDDEK